MALLYLTCKAVHQKGQEGERDELLKLREHKVEIYYCKKGLGFTPAHWSSNKTMFEGVYIHIESRLQELYAFYPWGHVQYKKGSYLYSVQQMLMSTSSNKEKTQHFNLMSLSFFQIQCVGEENIENIYRLKVKAR